MSSSNDSVTPARRRTNAEMKYLCGSSACERATNSPTGLSTSAIMDQHHACNGRFHMWTHRPSPDALPAAPSSADQGEILSLQGPSLVEATNKPSLQSSFTSSLLFTGSKKEQLFRGVISPASFLLRMDGRTASRLDSLTTPSTKESTATLASSSLNFSESGVSAIEKTGLELEWVCEATNSKLLQIESGFVGEVGILSILIDRICNFQRCRLLLGSTGYRATIWPTHEHRRHTTWCLQSAVLCVV